METAVLKIDPDNPDNRTIARAARAIKEGGLVAFPTETVYGLAANFSDKKAMARLCRVKRRPRTKPFTIHIADIKMVMKMGFMITEEAKALIYKFWPGPLTIILKSKDGRKAGFRMPANKIALDIIGRIKEGVALPSANVSGRPAPVNAGEVLKELGGKINLLIDGGPTKIGVESTVVDMTEVPPKVLREGAIKKEDLWGR